VVFLYSESRKGGSAMKAVCVKSYYDKQLKRKVTVGDELELTDERFKELSTPSNDAKMALVKAKPAKKAVVKKG
jgi:hypothetical protein